MTHHIRHHMLIGPPASGKSRLARRFRTVEEKIWIISTDAIRASLYGDEAIQGDWGEIEAVLLVQAQAAAQSGHHIVLDATNTNREYRRDLLTKLRTVAPGHWVGWWLETADVHCRNWNQFRHRQVPEEVIQAMYERLQREPPSLEDGLDSIAKVHPTCLWPDILAHHLHGPGCNCIDCEDYKRLRS